MESQNVFNKLLEPQGGGRHLQKSAKPSQVCFLSGPSKSYLLFCSNPVLRSGLAQSEYITVYKVSVGYKMGLETLVRE